MEMMQKQSPLLDALANLEFCLETPVVPGEMESWVETVDSAYGRVQTELIKTWDRDHPQKLQEISREDPEMLRCVTVLEEKDTQTVEKQKAFVHFLNNLAGRAARAEPDEARLDDRVECLIDAGLDLILHARRQEVAMDYWLLESLDRDRGVGD
jgi:hypothetical protein